MAYALASRLERALKNSGLTYKTVNGWQNRGHGAMGTIQSVLCHHTAGPKNGTAPSLNVVTYGRPGLSGPLCHIHLDREGMPRLVAAGRAYHAGTVVSSYYTNSHSIGIEAENTGLSNDQPWPLAQMVSYHLLCKALAEEFGLPVSRIVGHKEAAPRRKIDPTFSMPTFRKDVTNARLGTTTPTPEPEKGILGMTKNVYYQRTKRQSVKAGGDKHLQIKDEGGQYTIVSGPADFSISVRVDIAGLPKDKTARLKIAVVSYKAGTPTEVVAHGVIDEVYGSDGYSYAHATLTKRIPKERSGRSLRVRALLASDVDVEVDRVVVSGLRD